MLLASFGSQAASSLIGAAAYWATGAPSTTQGIVGTVSLFLFLFCYGLGVVGCALLLSADAKRRGRADARTAHRRRPSRACTWPRSILKTSRCCACFPNPWPTSAGPSDLTPRGVARPQSFGMGCGAAANWTGIAAMTFVTLVAGNALIFSLFFGISLGAVLFVGLFVRETKGRSIYGSPFFKDRVAMGKG